MNKEKVLLGLGALITVDLLYHGINYCYNLFYNDTTYMKKILITGYSHSGTTILKSIIGHIDNVHEIIDETDIVTQNHLTDAKNNNKDVVLIKRPILTKKDILHDLYKDYIKIFIMRDPRYVFSSINKRSDHNFSKNFMDSNKWHNAYDYTNIMKQFKHLSDNPKERIYTIKYEDLFDNNYEKLKYILDSIGLDYTDRIFDNNNYTNYSHSSVVNVPDEKPENSDHRNFRTWQINQPFNNKNIPSKILLTKEQAMYINESITIQSVYPNN